MVKYYQKKIYIAVALFSVLNCTRVHVHNVHIMLSTFTCINLATVDLDHSVRSSTRVYLVLVPRAVTKAFYICLYYMYRVHVCAHS